MEWSSEKIIQFLPIAVSVVLPLYMYLRTLREKKAAENREDKTELTSEIVADGSSIRKDLREMLKEEQARYDKVLVIVENLRKDILDLKGNIVDFRAEVKELKFINMTLTREKQEIEQKNDKLLAEKVLMENEIRDLLARVGDLEKQVKNLMER